MLHAVDDLLVEIGYSAMTMKGIADRAGVGRMTLYRWWPTKAHILIEACVDDAREELGLDDGTDAYADLPAYLDALVCFLTSSTAGLAYRALLGEAQHDQQVATLVHQHDLFAASASRVIRTATGAEPGPRAVAELVGPVLYLVLTGRQPTRDDIGALATTFLRTHTADDGAAQRASTARSSSRPASRRARRSPT